ncbi:MAG: hypothetical protein H6833_11665 [Planctomycetes bacterium]|nr:hypothetical protein [Planctomycetota bacterium]
MWKSFLLLSCVSSSLFGLASTQDPEPEKPATIRIDEKHAAVELKRAYAEMLKAGDAAAARALQEKVKHLETVAEAKPAPDTPFVAEPTVDVVANPFAVAVARKEDPRAILRRLLKEGKLTQEEYVVLEAALKDGGQSADAFLRLLAQKPKPPVKSDRKPLVDALLRLEQAEARTEASNPFEAIVKLRREEEKAKALAQKEKALLEAQRAKELSVASRAYAEQLKQAKKAWDDARERQVDVEEVFEQARERVAEVRERTKDMTKERKAIEEAERRLAIVQEELDEQGVLDRSKARTDEFRERLDRLNVERRTLDEARARMERDAARMAERRAESDRQRAERDEVRARDQAVRQAERARALEARARERARTGPAEGDANLRRVVERLDGEMKGIRRELEAINRKLDRLLGGHDIK